MRIWMYIEMELLAWQMKSRMETSWDLETEIQSSHSLHFAPYQNEIVEE